MEEKDNGEVLTYYKEISDPIDFEYWRNYDKNGNLIYSKLHNSETFYKYDDRGNVIYSKDICCNVVFETWCVYDFDNNLLHKKDSHGKKYWYEYDYMGNVIHKKTNTIFPEDKIGPVIVESGGDESWMEYEEKGVLKYIKNSSGTETWFKNGIEIMEIKNRSEKNGKLDTK